MARIPGRVGFTKSMKKIGKLGLMAALAFALIVLPRSVEAAGKPPTLEYGIIRKATPSPSTHPSPANDPIRGCNAENYCSHFTLSAASGTTRIEAFAKVDVGAPLNSNAPGLEAIAAGIAAWSLTNTKSRRLSFSMNATADADSAQMLQLAVSRGIDRIKGLDVEYGEETAALPPVDGNIAIAVGAATNRVDLKLMTHVESFGETDVTCILEYAKANILPGGH